MEYEKAPGDRKQVKMERTQGTLHAPNEAEEVYEFGPDDPRIDLTCIECGKLLATVPPGREFRRKSEWERVRVYTGCSTHNSVPLVDGEA